MANWGTIDKRYVGDANPNRRIRHVHDVANEKPSCTLHAIQWAKHVVPFATKEEAAQAGYVPCVFCMPYEKGAS